MTLLKESIRARLIRTSLKGLNQELFSGRDGIPEFKNREKGENHDSSER